MGCEHVVANWVDFAIAFICQTIRWQSKFPRDSKAGFLYAIEMDMPKVFVTLQIIHAYPFVFRI